MSYTKQTWANGDTITAEKLNHMESGIEEGAVTYPGYDVVIRLNNSIHAAVSQAELIKGSYDDIVAKCQNGQPVTSFAFYWNQNGSSIATGSFPIPSFFYDDYVETGEDIILEFWIIDGDGNSASYILTSENTIILAS